MEATARRGLRLLYWILGQEVSVGNNATAFHQRRADEVTLLIHIGIDLVGDAVVALILLEADIVRCRSHPYILSIELKRRLPDAQMMPLLHDRDRFGTSEAEILRASEEVEFAHRHFHVGLLLDR